MARGMLWRIAFSSRFETSRSISRRSPDTQRRLERGVERQPRSPPRAGGGRRPRRRGRRDRSLATAIPRCPCASASSGVDQLLLLLSLVEHLHARVAEGVDGRGRVADDHLEHRPRRGQRRAQLVRGVGDEPPLRVERRLESLEQAVDRVRELRVARPAVRPSPAAGRGSPRRSAGWSRSSSAAGEHPPGDQPTERRRDHRHDRQRDARFDRRAGAGPRSAAGCRRTRSPCFRGRC